MSFKFENLRVWQVSLEFGEKINLFGEKINLLADEFPKKEMFNLSNQIVLDSILRRDRPSKVMKNKKDF